MDLNEGFDIKLLEILIKIETVYIVALIAIGFISNSITFFVFAFNKVKFERVNAILASLAIADNSFLLTLFVVNLHIFNIDLFNSYEIVCKLTVFCTYISSFLSVWLIILFTIDRFIVVYFPFKHTLTKMNKIYIVILVITSVLLYGSSLVTSSLHPISGEKKVCTVKKKLIDFGRYLMLMDTGLSMILPFVFISTFNLLIVVKLHKANSYFEYHINQRGNFCTFQTEDLRLSKIKRKKLESTVSFNPNLTEQESVSLRGNSHSSSLNQNMLQSAKNSLQTSRFLFETKKPSNELILCSFQSKKKFNLNRTTYILVLISTSFLLLNLPMALCKLWYFFNPSSNQKSEQIEELVERISCYIYYLNFSINFFFYNFHSTKLRRVLYEFFYAIRFLKRRTLSSSSLKRKQSLPCERTKYPLVISFK